MSKKENTDERPARYVVAWAEYNHGERCGALNCDFFGAFATMEEARRAVMEDLEDEADNILSDYDDDDEDTPDMYRGKTAAQLARSWIVTDMDGFITADYDDGRECAYSIRCVRV